MKDKALKYSLHLTLELSISLHQKNIYERQLAKRHYSIELEFYCCRYTGVAFSKDEEGRTFSQARFGRYQHLEPHPVVYQLFKYLEQVTVGNVCARNCFQTTKKQANTISNIQSNKTRFLGFLKGFLVVKFGHKREYIHNPNNN